MAQRWLLHTPEQLWDFRQYIEEQWKQDKRPVVEFINPNRSISQNAKIYALYRKIADQREGMTFEEAKNYCKLHFGIGIMKSSDPEFADWYDNHIKGWDYEDKLFFVSHLEVTSDFDKEQASEYIDTIIQEWGRLGVDFS